MSDIDDKARPARGAEAGDDGMADERDGWHACIVSQRSTDSNFQRHWEDRGLNHNYFVLSWPDVEVVNQQGDDHLRHGTVELRLNVSMKCAKHKELQSNENRKSGDGRQCQRIYDAMQRDDTA